MHGIEHFPVMKFSSMQGEAPFSYTPPGRNHLFVPGTRPAPLRPVTILSSAIDVNISGSASLFVCVPGRCLRK